MKEFTATETSSNQKAEKHALRIRDYAQILIVTVLVALFLKTFVIAAYRIPSASMENTLRPGDFLLVNKFIYGAQTPRFLPFTQIEIPRLRLPAFRPPLRSDLVVFELPPYARDWYNDPARDTFVKRCIAVPGDTLSIVNRRVFVNDEELALPQFGRTTKRKLYPRDYSDSRIFPKGSPFNEDNYGPLAVPKRGDQLKLDAENFMRVKDVVEHEGHTIRLDGMGNVFIDGVHRTLYEVERNYFFMMGDNRDNSLDSRFWGFVPEEMIVGKVMVIYWSWDEDNISEDFLSRLIHVRWARIGTIVR